jgi:hypothetical protein
MSYGTSNKAGDGTAARGFSRREMLLSENVLIKAGLGILDRLRHGWAPLPATWCNEAEMSIKQLLYPQH